MEIKDVLAKYVDASKVDEALADLNKELPLSYIPKTKFNEINDELKLTKQQLADQTKSVQDLTKKASSLEEAQKQIEDLKKATTDLEAKAKADIAAITKRTNLKELLIEAGAHKDATDLLVEKYLGDVELDEKGVKDSAKLIEKIKAEKTGLFVTTTGNSGDKGGGKGNPPGAADDAKLKALFGLAPAPTQGGK